MHTVGVQSWLLETPQTRRRQQGSQLLQKELFPLVGDGRFQARGACVFDGWEHKGRISHTDNCTPLGKAAPPFLDVLL